MTTQPKEITKDCDTGKEVASFDYYGGLKYVTDNNLTQSGTVGDVFDGKAYIICCGDIMVGVKETDFPDIKRRII